MTPREIKRIRLQAKLTQEEAGRILGGGPRAFSKYERGVIKPAVSLVNLLRVLKQWPLTVLDVLREKR